MGGVLSSSPTSSPKATRLPKNGNSFQGKATPGYCYGTVKFGKLFRIYQTRSEALRPLQKALKEGTITEVEPFAYGFYRIMEPSYWITCLSAAEVEALGVHFPPEWKQSQEKPLETETKVEVEGAP